MTIFPKIKSTTLVTKTTFHFNFVACMVVFSLLVAPVIGLIFKSGAVDAASNTISFAAAVNYTIGSGPSPDLEFGPLAGDLNNDDNIDLVSVNAGANNVSVLIGNGDGTFDAAVNYTNGVTMYGGVLGDLNGDDYLDIVTNNNLADSISIFINDGDGTFAAAVNVAVGDSPYSPPHIADFNNDDDMDIMTANALSDNVTVLIGNGNGTFAAAVNYVVGDEPYDMSLSYLNNDAYLDVITANSGTDSISILVNDGDGTFSAKVDYAATAAGPYQDIITEDLNGDDEIDIVVVNSSSTMSVFIGNGDGTFDAKVDYTIGNFSYGIEAFDADNDDDLDLVTVSDSDDMAKVSLNNGNGTFAAAVGYTVSNYPYGVDSADFNKDGNMDIITPNYGSDNVSVLAGNGNGTFSARVDYTTGDGSEGIVVLDDFNEDSLTDIAVGNSITNTISILLNTTNLPTVGFSTTTGSGAESVSAPVISVVLDEASDVDVTIDYEVADVTAAVGQDYTLSSGSVVISAGDTSVDLPSLGVVNDTNIEGDETLEITLSNPLSAILDTGSDEFTYTIVDNDFESSGSTTTSGSKPHPQVENPVVSNSNMCLGYSDSDSCITQSEYIPGMNLNPNSNQTSGSNNQAFLAPVNSFLRNLGFSSIREDVKRLQQFLNQNNFILAPSGNGSPGKETNYYGPRTTKAITRFQEYYSNQILTPLGLTQGTGYFGEKTRGFVNNLVK